MSRPDAHAIAGYYDQYSTWYEEERREGYYSLINDLEASLICQRAAGGRTLELGCGTGLILERIDAVAQVAVGVDLSPGMAAVSAGKGLRAMNASATELPFPDATFDITYSCKVLAHVPDIRAAVAEAARVTKPGGWLLLEFYNAASWKALGYRVKRLLRRGDPVFIRFDDLDAIRSYLPPGVHMRRVRGIRTVAPTAHFYTAPVVGDVVRRIERALADRRLGRRFGGYLLCELHVDG